MAAITGTVIYEQDCGPTQPDDSPFEYKQIIAVTPATADASDTFTVTLADYGITSFMTIKGWSHSPTEGAGVIISEEPTTAVSSGVLTVTVSTNGESNKARVYLIGGI